MLANKTVDAKFFKEKVRSNVNAQQKRAGMTQKDWEDKFEMLFKQDLIDVPNDFFDEEPYFSDPNELNNIFTELEEKNLFLIHMNQE